MATVNAPLVLTKGRPFQVELPMSPGRELSRERGGFASKALAQAFAYCHLPCNGRVEIRVGSAEPRATRLHDGRRHQKARSRRCMASPNLFGGTVAVRDVSVALHAGEVLALLGENGAGKSTCVKLLAGVYRPDAGRSCSMGRRSSWARRSMPSATASRSCTNTRACSPI